MKEASTMAVIVILTDNGVEVDRLKVEPTWPPPTVGRLVYGRMISPMGWLGRALRDATLIQQGKDPERPSEKTMRKVPYRVQGGVTEITWP